MARCQPEQCNGRDDDCDGVIDNGCPIDQRPLSTRTVSTTSPIYGSVTEVMHVNFTDACPDGQVIIGLTGNAGSGLDAVGVNCGTLTVREDRSTTPYQYSVAVAAGMQYAPLGGTGGGQHALDNALLCGIDEVVTSIQVSQRAGGRRVRDQRLPRHHHVRGRVPDAVRSQRLVRQAGDPRARQVRSRSPTRRRRR